MRLLHTILIATLLLGQASYTEAQKQKKGRLPKVNKNEKAQLAEYAFSEGMKHFLLGNYTEAQKSFEDARKLGGDNAALDYMLAKIYIEADKLELALQYANKALKLDGKNKYYYLLVAEIHERKRNYPEAIKTYKKLLAEVPKSDEFYYNLGDLYYFQRNYEEALKTYTKIEEVFGKSDPVSKRKQDIYLKMGDLPKAIEEGESLIKAYPDDPDYKVEHADFLFKNKMPEKAAVILEQVIKEHPENSYARLLLSDIYKMQGQNDKSSEELEMVFDDPEADIDMKVSIITGYLKKPTETNKAKALELANKTVKIHPNEFKAHIIRGEALMVSNNKEEALKSFLSAKKIDNSNFNLWLQILTIDADLRKSDSLIAHSEQALETFPNQASLWMYNGLGHSMKKDYSKAVESLEEGKKLAGTNNDLKTQFNLQLGDNYHYLKEYAKSDASYDEVLKTDANNDHALNNYSYFLSLRKEKLDLAKTMCEKLVAKHPEEPTYLDTYAWVLYQMKNYEEARKYLEKAVKNSDNGTIVEHYGDTLYQLGQKEAAVEQWKKAKKLGETSELIDKKIADKKLYE